MRSCVVATAVLPFAQTGFGQVSVDAVSVAREFDFAGTNAVPMNFQTMILDLQMNPAARQTTGRAVITFLSPGSGRPYFLMKGPPGSLELNGQAVSAESAQDPVGNTVQVLTVPVEAGVLQTLQVDYFLSDDAITYREQGVGFVTAMADIDDGNFFEAYGPSSFEDDQFAMTMNLSLIGTEKPHQLFTNGFVTANSASSWSIAFPPYFTTSSFYVHLTDAEFAVRRGAYAGLEKMIPITVYSADGESADLALARLPGLFAELEGDYGPYLHGSFTAFISGAGGMEHDGATITSLEALGHELTHSWFGRGVMPANGSSGWIDEAIATWRDRDYPRSGAPGDLDPANIGNLSPFERFTPFTAYNQGGDLLTVLDNLFSNAFGLKPILRDFFAQWKTRLVTTQDFQAFLQERSSTDLAPVFARSVLGREAPGTVGTTPPPPPASQVGVAPEGTGHPPSLTPSEIAGIR